MNLNLKRPLFFFDLETTGVDIATDRIVEFSYLKVFPNGEEESRSRRINPEMPIPKEATEIHGISDEDVKDCPTFKQVAKSLASKIDGADIAGFNSNNFDVPLLVEEFLRAGIDVDFKKKRFVDVQTIYHKKEPRTLVAAYKFYCDKDLENAHSAEADTRATYEVFKSQVEKYADLNNDIDYIASTFNNNLDRVDFAGRIALNKDGIEVFNFGKYKGRPVIEVLREQPNYYNWMMDSDFTLNTKKELTKIKLKSK